MLFVNQGLGPFLPFSLIIITKDFLAYHNAENWKTLLIKQEE